MRLYYQLTLLDPVIISQTTATTNSHECLDYIPGSTILGALASAYYAELSAEQSWAMFHNGSCRFSPCYAVNNEQASLPVPASWHFEKGATLTDKQAKIKADTISNHAHPDFKRTEITQYKQWRDGYITAGSTEAETTKGLRTKTAIDAETGSAKNSKLFSYSYLDAGQTFVGWIECQDEAMLNKLKPTLNSTLRIGRSRNNEFGRVQLSLLDINTVHKPENTGKELLLWCLSDVHMLNQHGMPTLTPTLRDIFSLLSASPAGADQLPKGSLKPERSFIRSQRISRFNQTRKGLDSEQILISKGSVLVYELEQALKDDQLKQLSREGIGINKQQGLGWVYVNPEWATTNPTLDPETPLFQNLKIDSNDSKKKTDIKKKPGTARNTLLLSYLKQQIEIKQARVESESKVKALVADFIAAYDNARIYNNIANAHAAGPSPTQWGRIIEAVKDQGEGWKKPVLEDSNAIVSAKNDELGWGICWSEGSGLMSFAEFTKGQLKGLDARSLLSFLEEIKVENYSEFQVLKKYKLKGAAS